MMPQSGFLAYKAFSCLATALGKVGESLLQKKCLEWISRNSNILIYQWKVDAFHMFPCLKWWYLKPCHRHTNQPICCKPLFSCFPTLFQPPVRRAGTHYLLPMDIRHAAGGAGIAEKGLKANWGRWDLHSQGLIFWDRRRWCVRLHREFAWRNQAISFESIGWRLVLD